MFVIGMEIMRCLPFFVMETKDNIQHAGEVVLQESSQHVYKEMLCTSRCNHAYDAS